MIFLDRYPLYILITQRNNCTIVILKPLWGHIFIVALFFIWFTCCTLIVFLPNILFCVARDVSLFLPFFHWYIFSSLFCCRGKFLEVFIITFCEPCLYNCYVAQLPFFPCPFFPHQLPLIFSPIKSMFSSIYAFFVFLLFQASHPLYFLEYSIITKLIYSLFAVMMTCVTITTYYF